MSGEDFFNFVNEDRGFKCSGQNAAWFHPNGSQLVNNNFKYDLAESSKESRLIIKNINAFDIGEYSCFVDNGDQKFVLKVYCKFMNNI